MAIKYSTSYTSLTDYITHCYSSLCLACTCQCWLIKTSAKTFSVETRTVLCLFKVSDRPVFMRQTAISIRFFTISQQATLGKLKRQRLKVPDETCKFALRRIHGVLYNSSGLSSSQREQTNVSQADKPPLGAETFTNTNTPSAVAFISILNMLLLMFRQCTCLQCWELVFPCKWLHTASKQQALLVVFLT